MESFQAIEKINSTPDLSAKHFQDGSINMANVMEEVNYLKSQITNIRQELASFLAGLATITPGTKPSQVFEDNVQRVTTLQKTLDDYIERYRKLLPLMELVQRELGTNPPDRQDPSIKPSTAMGISSSTSAIAAAAAAAQKKQRKRSYTKKPNTGNTPGYRQTIPETDGSESQPILL